MKSFNDGEISTVATDELSSSKGDLVGYDYFKIKKTAKIEDHFKAQFKMPSNSGHSLHLNLWMKGEEGRELFSVEAPHSRAINKAFVPEEFYHKPLPKLIVWQKGGARTKQTICSY